MSKIRSTLLDAHLSCLQSICISNNFSCSTRKATRCLAAQEFHTFQRTIQEVSMLFLWHLPVGFPWVSGAVLLFAWTLPNKKSNKLLMGNGVSPCFRKFSTSLRLRWFCKLMHQKRAGVWNDYFPSESPRQLPVSEWLSSDEVRSQIHQARFHGHLNSSHITSTGKGTCGFRAHTPG